MLRDFALCKHFEIASKTSKSDKNCSPQRVKFQVEKLMHSIGTQKWSTWHGCAVILAER